MINPISQTYRKIIILIIATSFTALNTSCDSQKRVSKALQKLESNKGHQKIRSWPYNYTFHEYSEQLDDAELRQAFYEKRKTQALIAKDKKTAEVMQNNIETYQRTIDRLKDDKKFYKIYKLRSKEVELKIKEENKTKKAIEKQKLKLDRDKLRENKAAYREKKKLYNAQQQAIKERRKALEKDKKKAEKAKEEHLNKIKDKKKEIDNLYKVIEKAPESEQVKYQRQIQSLQNQIRVLQGESKKYDAPIKELEQNIALPDSVIQKQTKEVTPNIN